MFRSLQEFVRTHAPLEQHVHFTGYLDDAGLVALLNGAAALVFPSLWEGFGLPAVEAMSCGLPVLASRRSSLPEVIGDAGFFFDPESPAAIADCLLQFLQAPSRARAFERRPLPARAASPGSAPQNWQKTASGGATKMVVAESVNRILETSPRVAAFREPAIQRIVEGLRRMKCVAHIQAAPRFVYPRPSLWHIAGLLGKPLYGRRSAKRRFKAADHFSETQRFVVAEIDHLVSAPVICNRRSDAGDDVVDVGVVPPRRPIAEHRHGTPLEHQSGELVDREVRTLSRSIHCEKAQGDESYAVQVAVHVPEELAAHFGAGVRTDGLEDVIVFAPRHARVDSVHAARRREHKLLDTAVPRDLQQVLCAANVGVLIRSRVGNRRPHAGFGSEMDDGVEVAPKLCRVSQPGLGGRSQ